MASQSHSDRRAFLRGDTLRQEFQSAAPAADMQSPAAPTEPSAEAPREVPQAGDTLRLETRAMACRFSVIANPGAHEHIWAASETLDLVHTLEQLMTVYRDDSELSRINREASRQPVRMDPRLFRLLMTCERLTRQTAGAFDATSGPLIALWRQARGENRIPTEDEIATYLQRIGMQHVRLHPLTESVSYDSPWTGLNLGGIGKGFALDEMEQQLCDRGLTSFLLHGGHSSLLARGDHNRLGGWPVGIGNPLFTDRRLGTLLLKDQAMSTSGSNIQYFRYQGRRYGHILDPRTGWPVDGHLSVTVVAGSAAVADALSTAFFVLGVEKAAECCHHLPDVGAILTPQPTTGRRVRPVVLNIPDDQLFWESDEVEPVQYSTADPAFHGGSGDSGRRP